MKYAIYLDEVQTETFNADEPSAIKKYEEERENYKGEDMYEKIELVKFEVIKQDTL